MHKPCSLKPLTRLTASRLIERTHARRAPTTRDRAPSAGSVFGCTRARDGARSDVRGHARVPALRARAGAGRATGVRADPDAGELERQDPAVCRARARQARRSGGAEAADL